MTFDHTPLKATNVSCLQYSSSKGVIRYWMEFDLILCSSDLKTHRIIYSLRATTAPSEPCTKFSKYKSKGSKILTTGLQIKRVLEQPLIIKPVGHKIHSGQHLGKKILFDLCLWPCENQYESHTLINQSLFQVQ